MSSRQPTRTAPKRTAAAASKSSAPAPAETNGDTNNETVDSRRQKKRELDRRCQRMARERTKARIAYLEGLVEDFRQQDASGRVASLMKQLQDTVKERDELAKTLKLIENSIRSHKLFDGQPELKQEDRGSSDGIPAIESTGKGKRRTSSVAFDSSSMPPPTFIPNDETFGSSPEAETTIDITPENLPECVDEGIDLRNDFMPYLGENEDPIYPPPKAPCDCLRAKGKPSYNEPANIWRWGNETLAKRESYSDEIMELEDTLGDDIPVRALLEGWDAVEMRLGGTLPPMWQRLRKIDEVIFATCAHTERLAIMRVMHLLLKYHSQPTVERKKALPAWYIKRPSQAIAHSYAIDFFAWPGVRERFVFSQHKYCSNLFWYLFNRSLHIVWPYEFRDTYTYNTMTREYKISNGFEERIRDINMWTMGRDIFDKWPEFYGDFPTWEHMPMQVGGSMGPAMIRKMSIAGVGRKHDSSKAVFASHRGSVASLSSTTTTTTTAANGSDIHKQHPRLHIDRVQALARIDHRAPAEEVEDTTSAIDEASKRHSLPAGPVEVPSNLFTLQGFSDWWGSPFQYATSQHHSGHTHGLPHHDRSAEYAIPMTAGTPQETLNMLSQMYDLPI